MGDSIFVDRYWSENSQKVLVLNDQWPNKQFLYLTNHKHTGNFVLF